MEKVWDQIAPSPRQGARSASDSTQQASTDAGEVIHLKVCNMTLMYNYISHISYTDDLSPIPVWSAVKSYLTSWFAQNLSKRALNRLTVSTSTM